MTSIAEVIDGPERMQVRAIFVEYCTDEIPAWAEGLAVQQRAVILGLYKYVYYHEHSTQLFDLATGPQELHDLCEDADYLELAQKLRELVLND